MFLWWWLVWALVLTKRTMWNTCHYSLIPVVFEYVLWLLVVLCIFPQVSANCQPLTVQNTKWAVWWEQQRSPVNLHKSLKTSHLKHQLLTHTISKVSSAFKPLTCVYVFSFPPEPLLLEWTITEEDGNLGQCRKCRAGGCVRVKKGTVNVQCWALTPCLWVYRPGGGVLWRPGELLLRQSSSLCTLGSHHSGSPVPGAMGFPTLPLHWILLSLECPSCHPIQPPASVDLLPNWETSPGIKPFSFHPPEATDYSEQAQGKHGS